MFMNPALHGAYRKGLAAGEAGEPVTACPYRDQRKLDGRLTWSRAFVRAWVDGWRIGSQVLITLAPDPTTEPQDPVAGHSGRTP